MQHRRQRALARVGITQSDLARRVGVSRQAVQQVIAGHIRSERIEQAIALYTGVPHRRLFPPEGR